MEDQQNQPMPIDAGQGQNQVSTEPTLAAWRKWLEGPFQTMLQSTQLQQKLQEWGVAMEEDLTEQTIPSGAIQALNTRTGGIATNMDLKQSYMALGTYRQRKGLQPNFTEGKFNKVTTTGPIHQSLQDWVKWIKGPYSTMCKNNTMLAKIDEWEIDMEEYMIDNNMPTNGPKEFAMAAGLDSLTRKEAIRAIAAYKARKEMIPDFTNNKMITTTSTTTSTFQGSIESQNRMKELVGMLTQTKLENERMKEALIPELTVIEVEKLLKENLPYAWMNTLAVALLEESKVNQLADPTQQWNQHNMVKTVWRVLNEEFRVKRQGRQSAPGPNAKAVTASSTTPGACFNCGQVGHWSRSCPTRTTLPRDTNMVNSPPFPCRRCGNLHWEATPCPSTTNTNTPITNTTTHDNTNQQQNTFQEILSWLQTGTGGTPPHPTQ